MSNKDILSFDPDIDADPSFVCKPNPWPFPDKGDIRRGGETRCRIVAGRDYRAACGVDR